ncbi:MAG: hypothetical protein JO114_24425 [Planctomycetaceae bacterium]|nr:hypothetical protein [Planctomycetaceae bacterium]MBV8308911.1 hypothetical protein [Planctomycetaceae bacterium]
MPSTESKPNSGVAADPSTMIASFWTQWLEQSTRGTQALLEAMQVAGDPQQLQRHWLDAVSRSLDDFMRTPTFLQLLGNNLKAITDLKGMQDQAIQDTARHFGLPLAADITGLFERLHSTEQNIINRLQAIEERLKAIETKH